MRLSIRPLFLFIIVKVLKLIGTAVFVPAFVHIQSCFRWPTLKEFVISFIKSITGLLYKLGQLPNMFRIPVNSYSK